MGSNLPWTKGCAIYVGTSKVTTVFMAGSITIRHLDSLVEARIHNIVASGFQVVIGDADGADAAIQAYLNTAGSARVTVYCSGDSPRNNRGGWPVEVVATRHAKSSRAFFAAKDLRMADVADIGLMVWDTKSPGTLRNVIELLVRKKRAVIFLDADRTFKTITRVDQLEELVLCMPADARQNAERKIRLTSRGEELKHTQASTSP